MSLDSNLGVAKVSQRYSKDIQRGFKGSWDSEERAHKSMLDCAEQV